MKDEVEVSGLHIAGIESVNIHDAIKTGEPEREQFIDNYIKTLENLGQEDIYLVCYNFMPVCEVDNPHNGVTFCSGSYGTNMENDLPDETYKRLCHEPESWTVEVHTVEVYVGTGGEHQDEFLRGADHGELDHQERP